MLKKLFGGKSDNGFYVELNENQSTNGKVPAATQVAEEKKPEPAAIEVVEEKKAKTEPTNTVEEIKPEAVKKKSTKKKTSVKSKKKESTEVATTPTPVAASASSDEQPFWVKAMYKNSSNGQKADSETTFATDYLMPTPTRSRRRPGPSLNMFKDMARQAKTPKF
jgi:outer membrane biosynthesis protein TonB